MIDHLPIFDQKLLKIVNDKVALLFKTKNAETVINTCHKLRQSIFQTNHTQREKNKLFIVRPKSQEM